MNRTNNSWKDVRGAVYIPRRAFNAPQTWRNYSAEEAARDMGYAALLKLNAVRVWASYEYWRVAPKDFAAAFDDFLAKASAKGIRVMPSLFENCGVPPTEENLWTTDPTKAYAIRSPHKEEIVDHPERWGGPLEFVEWFMDRWGNDARVLAVEMMNEPMPLESMRFARAMFLRANELRGSAPLTLGAAPIEQNLYFLDLGIDILQFHDNFPRSAEAARQKIEGAIRPGKILNKPVWMTEWQRLRPTASGWSQEPVPENEAMPALATLAPIVQSYEIGNFFWSLMVKPAYLPAQRPHGTINGVFWEDGAVWSLADARAVSGNPKLQLEERPGWPDWAPPRDWRGKV